MAPELPKYEDITVTNIKLMLDNLDVEYSSGQNKQYYYDLLVGELNG